MKRSEELNVFVEVARWKSFAEASRRVGIPTTSVSRKIQLLEEELSVKLFIRNTRSVTLTEIGERLLPKAEQVLESLDELRDEVSATTMTPRGVFRLTCPSAILHFVSPVIANFAKIYPTIRFILNSSNRNEDLIRSGYDFAFRVGPLKDSSQVAISISSIHYAVVMHKKWLTDVKGINHPSQLEIFPCIRNSIDGHMLPWLFKKGSQSIDVNADKYLECDDLFLATQMATEGLGAAYVPYMLVKDHIKKGTLIEVLKCWMPKDRTLYLVFNHRDNMPLKSSLFIKHIKQNKNHIQNLLGRD
jgi:DNA-binding transcriptional LysR family regulator